MYIKWVFFFQYTGTANFDVFQHWPSRATGMLSVGPAEFQSVHVLRAGGVCGGGEPRREPAVPGRWPGV